MKKGEPDRGSPRTTAVVVDETARAASGAAGGGPDGAEGRRYAERSKEAPSLVRRRTGMIRRWAVTEAKASNHPTI